MRNSMENASKQLVPLPKKRQKTKGYEIEKFVYQESFTNRYFFII